MSTPMERQATSSSGLRERLFALLDDVIDGSAKKESVEGACLLSQEILKSAKIDLEYENMAQRKIKLLHNLEIEKAENVRMLGKMIETSLLEYDDDDEEA